MTFTHTRLACRDKYGCDMDTSVEEQVGAILDQFCSYVIFCLCMRLSGGSYFENNYHVFLLHLSHQMEVEKNFQAAVSEKTKKITNEAEAAKKMAEGSTEEQARKKKAEQEAREKKAEEEAAARKIDETLRREAEAAQMSGKKAEEETRRKKAEEGARKKMAEEEGRKEKSEEEAVKKKVDEEAAALKTALITEQLCSFYSRFNPAKAEQVRRSRAKT